MGSSRVPLVGQTFNPVHSLDKVEVSAGEFATLDECFCGGNPNLLLLTGKQRGFISQTTLKRGHTRGGVDVGVHRIFGPGKVSTLGRWIL